ncbi:PaaI family thioesterase [Pseudalkalibacillus salsuginis]|uniref:PaaI family thioesterase n=1 Tax=Pseudalkalibacillus salsuginis TaxID=2910972 RepID=UPI001F217F34|nr:PaaI family thioesterase [Pseudalkalibacillus salsuginis]MCF6410437.1 PaaI family thioesterase [Pseudalkalibacillus salsuginis]
MESSNQLLEKVKAILESGSDKDKMVLEQIVDGICEKQFGSYSTYITSFMKTEIEQEEDLLVMTIPITPFLDNSVDIVHGGFTATLADTAMGTFVNRKIPNDKVAVTSEMKINYTAPGVGEFLVCKAEILHLGTKTSVTEAKIYNEEGILVAAATGSFYLIPR